MKTFKEYLAESKKTYQARIKIAGELPENFEANLKNYMDKYETLEFKKVASTPVQEHPHEFTRLKNVEVSIFDVETDYPIGYQQLESVLKDEFGIAGDHIRVKHPTDPTEIKPEEKEYEPKLTDAEYKDDTAEDKPLFGDEYNMTMFKELMTVVRKKKVMKVMATLFLQKKTLQKINSTKVLISNSQMVFQVLHLQTTPNNLP